MEKYVYETLLVTHPAQFVIHVELNRPEKRNAMNRAFWREILDCFEKLRMDQDCRCVVLSGAGKIFSAGLDISDLPISGQDADVGEDITRRAPAFRVLLEKLQQSFTAIEQCPKPVIAAIHSACVGGGVDMVTACDIRMCTQDAWFQVKEVDLGIAADVGTLQRLPKVVGNESLVREICMTARRLHSAEAQACGLVSSVHETKEHMMKAALELASEIAAKSPVAVQGTKVNLVYARDHSVAEGLNYVAVWNQLYINSEDVAYATMASMQKTKPKFSKL